jgi:hypothetical protein
LLDVARTITLVYCGSRTREDAMRHFVLAATIALASIASHALAGGYSHGNGSGSCSFIPSSGVVGQPFSVAAIGLPVGVEVDLIVTNYEAPTRSFGPLAVNSDGTWTGTFTAANDGWWNFDFVSPSTNSTRLPNLDASCKIRVR